MARSPRLKIHYSSILNRNITLVSHQDDTTIDFSQPLNEVRRSLLKDIQITSVEQRLTSPVENFQFHVLADHGILYLCITDRTDAHYLPFSFLHRVKDEFSEQPSLISRSYRANEDELDRDFAPVLGSIMNEYNSGRADKVAQVEDQIEDVKQSMLHNVERVLERGERLDDLLSKTEELESQGQEFRRQARIVHSEARCKNMKLWLIILAMLAIVVTLLALFACGVLTSR